MANLNKDFPIVGALQAGQAANIEKKVGQLAGVERVEVDSSHNNVRVGYTAGLVTIQQIKEVIESQGCDVADRGDD